MLDITKDIQSLTTFRRCSGRFMKQLKKSHRPVVLTVRGKAAAVVQDAEAYQRLLDIAARADAREGIRQGLEEAREGRAATSKNSSPSSKPLMAYRVKIMPRAQRDLAGIYDSIHASSSDAAHVWYMGLRNGIGSLCQKPNRTPATPEDRRLRHLLYGHKPHIYRVIYRVVEEGKEVEVLHIRHGARDRFPGEPS